MTGSNITALAITPISAYPARLIISKKKFLKPRSLRDANRRITT